MPKNNHVRNVNGLLSHAASKSKAVSQRIDTAIRTLIGQNASVNFNAVANLAHVSKTTLYSNPDYRLRIERLRQNALTTPPHTTKSKVTDRSKDVLLAAKNKRIRELEAEVERLSEILKHYYGSEYDKC
ncbi:DUF6262 family protein [Bacteroides sp.]|uniref:DUF6262 family protein n=1 Tax=Bacteroides sp. TaxID=29523 RepID=UPI002604C68A|nr:DUF6262 family protein [Bacteroides sp.]MDD3041185.1 DUF6262 family protein [Bacteroides sp.]